jgi:hypothetical protein
MDATRNGRNMRSTVGKTRKNLRIRNFLRDDALGGTAEDSRPS